MADVKMLRRGLQDRKIPRRMLGWIFDLAPLSRHCQLTAPLRSSFSLFTLLPRFRKTRRIFIFLVAELNNFFSTNFFLSLFLLLNQFLEIIQFGVCIIWTKKQDGGRKTWYFSPKREQIPFAFTNWKEKSGRTVKTAFSWSNNSVN